MSSIARTETREVPILAWGYRMVRMESILDNSAKRRIRNLSGDSLSRSRCRCRRRDLDPTLALARQLSAECQRPDNCVDHH